MDRVFADRIDDFQLDGLGRQQPNGPAGAALGSRPTSYRHQVRLLRPIQLSRSSGPRRFASECFVETLFNIGLTDAMDGGGANVQGLGDLLVGSSRTFPAGIRLE